MILSEKSANFSGSCSNSLSSCLLMPYDRQSVSRIFIIAAAMGGGILLAVTAQTVLAKLDLDLGAVWRELGPKAGHLRAAFAWWLIAGICFIGGFVIAALAKYLLAHPTSLVWLRWIAGAAIVAGLTVVGRKAVAPPDLRPMASVVLGLSVLCLAGVVSLLGAFFVVRR